MLISVETLTKVWGVKPSGVLHVGAHEAEELEDYEKFNWGKVIWVEAQPDKANKLRERLANSGHTVLHGAAWDVSGEILNLNIASNSQSTSLLELGTHADSYPDITYVEKIEVPTIRLDEEIDKNEILDFANFDIQGSELKAMNGLGDLVEKFKWIYTEVNKESVYKDCAIVGEIDEYLSPLGFVRVTTRWVPNKGWGDALYIQRNYLLPKHKYLIAVLSNLSWRLSPKAKRFKDLSKAALRRIFGRKKRQTHG